jgi:hypothetical protein
MSDLTKRPRPRKAVGPERPTYFNQTDIDRVMAVVLALASEVSALRDRLDTHERLADEGKSPTFPAVESYQPKAEVEQAREIRRDAYIKRIFRVITEDIE